MIAPQKPRVPDKAFSVDAFKMLHGQVLGKSLAAGEFSVSSPHVLRLTL